MTRIDKLYERLLTNPRATIAFRDFEKLLEAFGFELCTHNRQSPAICPSEATAPFAGPASSKDAKRYQVREFLELVEEHGLYIER